MKIIKTTKKQRELFTKHLDNLEDYALGNPPKNYLCYMCISTHRKIKGWYLGTDCSKCPLSSNRTGSECSVRTHHLR